MPAKKGSRKNTNTSSASGASKVNTEEKRKEKDYISRGKKQSTAIILFAISLFLAAVCFIPGENVWNVIHDFLFGCFGFCSYLVPIIICVISVFMAFNKQFNNGVSKVVQGIVLVGFICAAIQIFGPGATEEGTGFFKSIATLYEQGVHLQGGGLAGSLIGIPLIFLLGLNGAKVTILLLIFVLVCLITGLTLRDIVKAATVPYKKIEESYAKRLEKKNKFDIDVDLGEDDKLPDHPVSSSKATTKTAQAAIDANENITKQTDKAAKKIAKASEILMEKADGQDSTEEKEPERSFKVDDILGITQPEEEVKDTAEERESEAGSDEPAEIDSGYSYPPITLLNSNDKRGRGDSNEDVKQNAVKLVDTLKSFGVSTRVVDISRGPAVTRYELQPSAGVKISKITGLADDIALNLAASGVRIEAPIPNKAAVGIEVPNKNIDIVSIKEIIDSAEFDDAKSKLTISLGKDISGNVIVTDVAKMPHMLIAGATGSGKSVCINSIIISLLYKSSPDDVRLLMIDPKVVELGSYNGIPHLLVPVVTDPRKAAGALSWAVNEMLNRYKIFAENNVRDLTGYNHLAKVKDDLNPMPQIVIIIDELADLMMAAPNEVEDAICRLAQMARAAGMHLVIATQRPSVDVITGVIKANIPSRIAFAVSSQVDSRTILDSGGAEKLLGRGDMLFFPVGYSKPVRIQGCFVSDKEVEKVVSYIKNQETAKYDNKIISEIESQAAKEKNAPAADKSGDEEDEMLQKAIEVVVEAGQASTSLLQRKLKLGYARAARIVDEMEERGIVGPYEGSKPRQVLLSKQQWHEMLMRSEVSHNEETGQTEFGDLI